jgi:hypothetical protein
MTSGWLPYILLLPFTASFAAPWGCDLEHGMPALPWVCLGDILRSDVEGADFVVRETFIGEAIPGDTVRAAYWESGSMTCELAVPGEGLLLISDEAGDLQVIGFPGNGYWLLQGEFDYNAFWVRPGVVSREELLRLCEGDTLLPRQVALDVRFAGRGDLLEVAFWETDNGWESRSAFPWLDGLELGTWDLSLGGEDLCPFGSPVSLRLRASDGSCIELQGRVLYHHEEGAWHCSVYPTSPMILDPHDLQAILVDGTVPAAPILDMEIEGTTPAALGLAESPYLTTDRQGRLLLSGEDGFLEITRIHSLGYGIRPVTGFDVPGTCGNPLYLRFDGLPDGPSGHLATDIIDVLAKGVVSGSLSADGDPEAPGFTLRIRRESVQD